MPLLIFPFVQVWRYGGDDTSFPDITIVSTFECARLNSQESGTEKWMSFFFFFSFLSVPLEMLRLKRIFCSFPRKSEDYLSYCGGLATAGSSLHSQVKWIHQSKTRCQFASPRIFTQSSSQRVSYNWATWVPFLLKVAFLQWWSQFAVFHLNFSLLIDKQTDWLCNVNTCSGCRAADASPAKVAKKY